MKKFLASAIEIVLTEKQRRVLEMYYVDKKNIPEIANILEVHKSTVQRTLKVAVEKLKKNKRIFDKSCI
jgi:RNA polymerase sigma factor (sigma-70 family)